MDLKLIQRLLRMMERAGLTELEVDDSSAGMRVHLKRAAPSDPAGASPVLAPQVLAPQVLAPQVLGTGMLVPPPLAGVEGIRAGASSPPSAAAKSDAEQGVPIASPMVGTFYRAASPEAEPFVSEGSTVAPDTVICIIEAMKVMNEIKAEKAGQVLRVLVENGEPVEFGQPLFLIRPA